MTPGSNLLHKRRSGSPRLLFVAAFALVAQAVLASALDDIHRFGPLAQRLTLVDLKTISRVAADESGGPWAVFAEYSQILPETWYVDAFLAPTVSTSMARGGPLRHLECKPKGKAGCIDWRLRPNVGRYIQVADGPGFGGAGTTVRRTSERPIQIDGEFSDRDLVSLVLYIRSKPKPKSDGGFVTAISGRYPIIFHRTAKRRLGMGSFIRQRRHR